MIVAIQANAIPGSTAGCAHENAQQCVSLALDAMGSRERLRKIVSVRLQTVGHTLLMEQSYRQSPFITSYERAETTLDLLNQRLLTNAKLTWPESDPQQSDSETTLVVGPSGGVYRGKDGDTPCSLSALDGARDLLALGPLRLLLTALDAPDLHFEALQTLRSTSHTVVAFTWQGSPVRVLLNSFNHLPDAVEATRQFHDFWYFWGDVQQRVYLDNYKMIQGVVYPTNQVEERNGLIWRSMQALNVEFNVPIAEKAFAMDAAVANKSTQSRGWNRPFSAAQDSVLAPGIDVFLGSWNSTLVKQDDGIVILEAPISATYMQGVIDEAHRHYPGAAVKAVLSTSDSWPHTGGVRLMVAQNLPVYVLDLNRPLLDRMMKAPHTLEPDALQRSQGLRQPLWRIVSGSQAIGSGANRMQLYPLRGASTERQYMVYFPEHRILYASDTLALNDDGSLYDPELMREVVQAVEREGLEVGTVFAMHQGPMPWGQMVSLIEKSQHPAV